MMEISAFTKGDTNYSLVICGILLLLVAIDPMIKAIDQRPKIIINTGGIRVIELDGLVRWEYLVSSYIKTVTVNETSRVSLILHYYDEIQDGFTTVETDLESLDKDSEEISIFIEDLKDHSAANSSSRSLSL